MPTTNPRNRGPPHTPIPLLNRNSIGRTVDWSSYEWVTLVIYIATLTVAIVQVVLMLADRFGGGKGRHRK